MDERSNGESVMVPSVGTDRSVIDRVYTGTTGTREVRSF